MKSLFQTILLLLSAATYGQTQRVTSVELATGDCRTKESYSWRGADTVIFYKLPEDTVMFKIIPGQYRHFPVKLESVPVSDYRLAYKNNYRQSVTRLIRLTERKNLIRLCPDSLSEYAENSLENLQEKDSISINFRSQGCFHSTASKITISKEVGSYVARLYDVNQTYAVKKKKARIEYKGDSLLQTITLTKKNIQDFIRFENELNAAHDYGCTTMDWYEIESKYLNIKKADGSCSWNGFYYLRDSFFDVKK